MPFFSFFVITSITTSKYQPYNMYFLLVFNRNFEHLYVSYYSFSVRYVPILQPKWYRKGVSGVSGVLSDSGVYGNWSVHGE